MTTFLHLYISFVDGHGVITFARYQNSEALAFLIIHLYIFRPASTYSYNTHNLDIESF
jgi:hypothetical protein